MRAAELWVLAYLLNSLWQVPLVFFAAWGAARLARQAGSRFEHRVWVCALMFEVLLPACDFPSDGLWRHVWGLVLWFRDGGTAGGVTRIILGPASVSGTAVPWLSPAALAAVSIAYLCGVVYFAGRLGWGVWKTQVMRRQTTGAVLTDEMAERLEEWKLLSGARERNLLIATSRHVSGPAAVGMRRQSLLVPPGFLEKLSVEELHALLGHESAHMQRHDFAKNLFYGFISLPVAYHPLLWLTRRHLAETRELICDAMAADALGARGTYARSLLRIAAVLAAFPDNTGAKILNAIGILDANIFERRVMYLTRKRPHVSAMRRYSIAAICILAAFSTCVSAVGWRMQVNAPEQKKVKRVAVADKMLVLTHKVDPVYPEAAKKDGLSGEVVLALHISKDGVVEDIHVVKGLHLDVFQTSAMDAVRQWRYQPFLLNGDPIAVDTEITVVFSPK